MLAIFKFNYYNLNYYNAFNKLEKNYYLPFVDYTDKNQIRIIPSNINTIILQDKIEDNNNVIDSR